MTRSPLPSRVPPPRPTQGSPPTSRNIQICVTLDKHQGPMRNHASPKAAPANSPGHPGREYPYQPCNWANYPDLHTSGSADMRFLVGGLGALVLVGGAWLCVPGPSHTFETLQATCQVGDRATVRLYEGNAGATSSFWYSVTVQTGGPWTERQVFLANGFPVVTHIACDREGVGISAEGMTWSVAVASVEQGPSTPIQYNRGTPTTGFRTGIWGPPEVTRTIVGGIACAGGVALLVVAFRRRRRNGLPNSPLQRSESRDARPGR